MKSPLNSSSRSIWTAQIILPLVGVAFALGAVISIPTASSPSLAADETQGKSLYLGSLPVSRILFLGNSITLHGPKKDIGWEGNWGMAASSQDKDYVHVLTKKIAGNAGGEPQILIRNIADFERGFQKYPVAERLQKEMDFAPQLVVLAIGENVPALKTVELKSEYRTAFRNLVKEIQKAGPARIVVRSSFYPDETIDTIMRDISQELECLFVDIHELSAEPKNYGRMERSFQNEGVAGHPGDRGMQAIADSIWKALVADSAVSSR